MEFHWFSFSGYMNRQAVLKVAMTILVSGLAVRFTFFGPFSEFHFLQDPVFSEPPLQVHVEENSVEPVTQKGQCDLFKGEWIKDPSAQIYDVEGCPFIDSHQSCMKNGRPDSGYLYWRWKPTDCDLPSFDAKKFLEFMRNKRWVLIGDSISRNHVQSLLCMLSKEEKPVEVYHDEEYRSKRWHFYSHNLTVSVIWSPFLVDAVTFEDSNGVSVSDVELQLDRLDSAWTGEYTSYDYIIISTGQWFFKYAIYLEKGEILGCHSCRKKNVTRMGFDHAYRKTLKLLFNFILSSKHKGMTFFRTSAPDHFEEGEWSGGGRCGRTEPVREGEMEMKQMNMILLRIELDEFEKAVAAAKAALGDVNLKLLNTSRIMLSRPDGHPGPYREFYPFAKNVSAPAQNDCLHWCLPGPIDRWNDILMEMLIHI